MPHTTTGSKEHYYHQATGKYGSVYIETSFNNLRAEGTLEVWYKGDGWGRFELLEKIVLNSSFDRAKEVHDSVLIHWRKKLKI